MGWNGSDSVGLAPRADRGISHNLGRATSMTSPQRRDGTVASSWRSYRRGLVAGLIVIVLGTSVALWLCRLRAPKEAQETKVEQRPSQITEAKPQIVTNVASVVPPKKDDRPRALNGCPLDQCYRDEKGILRMPGGARVLTKPPARTIRIGEGKKKVFEHRSETLIAGILRLEPGDLIVGTLKLDQKFNEDFKRALTNPTLVKSDDSPETAQLKRDVHEAMAELKARMDAGEDPGKLLTNIREEYRRLGVYRMQLQDEISKMRRDGSVSDADYADAVKAANIMLEKKGAKPISMPRTFFSRAFKLRNKNQKVNKQ